MLNQGRVFYIVPPPCQPFIFRCFRLRKSPKNLPAYYLFRGAHSTANRFPVNRFLKNLETQFLQLFQSVTPSRSRCISGLPLRRKAHSTDLPRGVNGSLSLFGKSTAYRQNSVFTAVAARVAFSLASAIEPPVARATPIRRRPLSSGLPNSLRKISGSASAFSSPE